MGIWLVRETNETTHPSTPSAALGAVYSHHFAVHSQQQIRARGRTSKSIITGRMLSFLGDGQREEIQRALAGELRQAISAKDELARDLDAAINSRDELQRRAEAAATDADAAHLEVQGAQWSAPMRVLLFGRTSAARAATRTKATAGARKAPAFCDFLQATRDDVVSPRGATVPRGATLQ